MPNPSQRNNKTLKEPPLSTVDVCNNPITEIPGILIHCSHHSSHPNAKLSKSETVFIIEMYAIIDPISYHTPAVAG